MICTRCRSDAKYDLELFIFGKAVFVCFACRLCNHYSDCVAITNSMEGKEYTRFMTDQSLLDCLNEFGEKRKEALREILKRRSDRTQLFILNRGSLRGKKITLTEALKVEE